MSLYFLGNDASYLRIPNTSSLNFGTGDFTIEWYQYQTDSNPFPRIFQIGDYNTTISIGVSIEGGSFYYWTNSSANFVMNLDNYKNTWVHFAISRFSGVTQIFMNGSSIFSMDDSNDFSSSSDLIISNESTPSTEASFGGYMTYFSWVKGVSLYKNNFNVSNTYPKLTINHDLLLKATKFDGNLGNTIINNNVSTVSDLPPNFITNPVPPLPPPPPPVPTPRTLPNFRNIGSLFTNNAMVYYKKGSLARCGVGSVVNSSIKSKRI